MILDKYEVMLKQHTPIIHFQSEEFGATLRASELKPKLDKFLIEYFKKNTIDYKKFLIKDTQALNYKLKIIIDDSKNNIIDLKDFNAYFGNIGLKEEEKIKGIINSGDIKVQFIFYSQDLKNAIETNFPLFLILHNFGTRQNKGFGCFYVKDINKYKPIELLKNNKNKFIYGVYNNSTSLEIAKKVTTIYALMKSGLNYPDHPLIDKLDKDGKAIISKKTGKNIKIPDYSIKGSQQSYYKSFLFQYMLSQIGNEKKFIKENFFGKSRITSDGVTKKYVRALLGTSDGIEFRDKDRNGKINYSSNQIERFQSPILFKIIDDTILIIPQEINNDIFGKDFNFSQVVSGMTINKSIKVPEKNEFDIYDFVYKFAEYLNTLETSNSSNNPFDKAIKSVKTTKFEGVKYDN